MGTIIMKSIYLNKKEVARKFNKSLSTISRWAKTGVIPLPIQLGPNTTVWIEDELDQDVEEKKKKRGFLGHNPKKKD
jgi:predicted DNA-binding transcriptional regulator AlpA